MIKVLIYNEFIHEQNDSRVREIYPNGIHNLLKSQIEDENIVIDMVTLNDVNTITEERLADTDVLIWWGHLAHDKVPEEVAERVKAAVNSGMGFIALHSAHHSKPFKKILGTTCNLTWREEPDRELVWVINPHHPISQGLGRFIKLDQEEAYGEPFAVPEPDELVFIGSFKEGEVFRSGCCYHRGGNIFYFQPGHEEYKTFYNKDIIRVIRNAIYWAKPTCRRTIGVPMVKKPLED